MDGAVTLEDAQIALRAALRITGLDAQQLQRADVDGEKGITLKDAQMILRAALRIEALQES